ncbi:MAG: 2Fe-2S iron-sulfur cluster binding domain-containing protein [Planctomycetes bacterium]|jgi:[NiFe] hydrogenase diaphorase moiety small subunit|nr:(2Fe-2S)-binding protein [Phycisphaerae bacterium]NBB94135.1 2Fe-2S iron-sulfur cluster binding domain-containing protein [Planctomycetota bacterium]
MSENVTLTIDGKDITGEKGQTIMDAALANDIYIPHLCHHPDLAPYGSCRVCTCLVNGRPQTACTFPISDGMEVENDTDTVNEMRKQIVEMLFVEGNHYCMFCEKSGNCELQALAYRFGVTTPRYPYQFPKREVDASHPNVWIDRDRCVLCARCIRASKDVDGKHAFDFAGRGPNRHISVDAADGIEHTPVDADDKAVQVCPVGSLMLKRQGYKIPIGQRKYDHEPIGTDIETGASKKQ